jgi:CRISPR-associated protein Csm1
VCDDCAEKLQDSEEREVEQRDGVVATYRRPEETDDLHEECFEKGAVSPIYINYSGGDDMLFVAPWDEALEMGATVREEFDEYTSGALSISAGFHLTRAKSPIGRSMQEAEAKLETAKGLRTRHARKDGAYLFGEALHWDDDAEYRSVNDLLSLGRRLDALIQDDEIPSSMVHSFLELRRETYPEKARGDERIPPDEVSISKEYVWRLKYLLSRNLEGDTLDELDDKVPKALPWVNVPVSWASLSNR